MSGDMVTGYKENFTHTAGYTLKAHVCAYLLLNDTTIPLFQLSFPIVGTLHGAHMFAASHGAGQLVSTVTDKMKVAWKVYKDRYCKA